MKIYLYINGRMMPNPPDSVILSAAGSSECISLLDESFHVFISLPEPEALTAVITFPDDKSDVVYGDSDHVSVREAVKFIKSAMSAPFELVILGEDDGGEVVYDLNMTVYATDVSISHKGDASAITIKARKYVNSGCGR